MKCVKSGDKFKNKRGCVVLSLLTHFLIQSHHNIFVFLCKFEVEQKREPMCAHVHSGKERVRSALLVIMVVMFITKPPNMK